MKKFFSRIGKWFSRHKPTRRRIVQLYAALLANANLKGFFTGNIYAGGSKYVCAPGLNCYSCPGAIGACPLGALQNALAQSKTSTPYYVIGILILFGMLLGRTICGFLCPIGLGQELLYKINVPKLKKSRVTRVLSYFKYVVLVAFVIAIPVLYSLSESTVPGFCKYICPAGTFGGALGLLVNPANAGLYEMLGPLFTWKFCLMTAFCVACAFIFRAFCRFFCPLGAIYGFFNKLALIGVKVDKDACTDCGLCVTKCKMDVARVGDHECINCGECIDVCPAKAISWKGSKLFVHKNAPPVLAEEPALSRPLGALLEPAAVSESASAEAPASDSERSFGPLLSETSERAGEGEEKTAPADEPEEKAAEAILTPPKKRGREFWLRFAAWGLALAVLVSALVYYNFFDEEKKKPAYGNEVGDSCPDFVLPVLQGEGETFSVAAQEGKVLILNFWTTYCEPCKKEIPSFEQIAEEFSESVSVAIVHGVNVIEDVPAFIRETMGWGDYVATFLQDTEEQNAYASLGGRQTWPMTVILDDEGVIAAVHQGEVTYELIRSEVEVLLGG